MSEFNSICVGDERESVCVCSYWKTIKVYFRKKNNSAPIMTKNSSALNCCELTVVVFVLECVQRVCVIVCASECVCV